MAGSAAVAAVTLRREMLREARAGRPPPRILAWWARVARYWSQIVGVGLVAAGVAFALDAQGRHDAALVVGIAGVAVAGYGVQAWFMRRVAARAAREAAANGKR